MEVGYFYHVFRNNCFDTIHYIIILSWNFTEEILKKLEPYRKNGIRIIIPFPEIKFI